MMQYLSKTKETVKTVESSEDGLTVTGTFTVSSDGTIISAEMQVTQANTDEGQLVYPGVLSLKNRNVNMSVPESNSSAAMSALLVKTFSEIQKEAKSSII